MGSSWNPSTGTSIPDSQSWWELRAEIKICALIHEAELSIGKPLPEPSSRKRHSILEIQRELGRELGKSERFCHWKGWILLQAWSGCFWSAFTCGGVFLVKFSPQHRVSSDLVPLEHPGHQTCVWFCVNSGYKRRPQLRPDLGLSGLSAPSVSPCWSAEFFIFLP